MVGGAIIITIATTGIPGEIIPSGIFGAGKMYKYSIVAFKS
jgi:hypothetical protein